MKAYAMCPSCNFVHEQPSLQSCKDRRTAEVACSAQPCPTVSHDATVLGPKPSVALIRASMWLIRRHRKSSSVTSSKIRLPGSSPSGPRCRRDCDSHEDHNGNNCDRAHHLLKERIPCHNQRASLLMGNCSRVLRWPSRNGFRWRPVVDWRESATALR